MFPRVQLEWEDHKATQAFPDQRWAASKLWRCVFFTLFLVILGTSSKFKEETKNIHEIFIYWVDKILATKYDYGNIA